MAKGQLRGNREAKKPKKKKEIAAVPTPVRGTSMPIAPPTNTSKHERPSQKK
ncbi:hypothetical protein AB4Z10_09175 [Bosea sp. RAF48]|uniref:hypothetical protein n=1 Tax=Bosea sp. RAF48 TaxID=3237480 RepID=UPI003F8FF6BC